MDFSKADIGTMISTIRNVPKGAVIFGTVALLNIVSSKVLRTFSTGRVCRQGNQALRNYWSSLDGEHKWLEEVEGDDAMDWVKGRNALTFAKLGDPNKSGNFKPALDILNSKEKIPHISKIDDLYYNFWTDEKNQRGLIRRTTLLSYKSKNPRWETVLDIDELGRKEGESWVYKGYVLYKPDMDSKGSQQSRRIMLKLSRGGADATVVREYE